jgi:hypothetical protein
MLALVKREIEDHIVYFLGAAVFSASFIAIAIHSAYALRSDRPPYFISVYPIFIIISMLGFCSMGVTQMYTDKTRKISSFLSTLAATRRRILIAKIAAGILAILTLLVPLAVTTVVLLRVFTRPLQIYYSSLVFEMSAVIFLVTFACYCVGLQNGWGSSKLTPTLGSLALVCILVPLIIIKGFSLHTVVILLLFIAASLVRTWYKFMTTSL